MQENYGVASSKWVFPAHALRPKGERFETGFLVHVVPIGKLMEWCGRSSCMAYCAEWQMPVNSGMCLACMLHVCSIFMGFGHSC